MLTFAQLLLSPHPLGQVIGAWLRHSYSHHGLHSITCRSNLSWDNALLLYASQNSVSPVVVLAIILYTHSTLGSSSGHIPSQAES